MHRFVLVILMLVLAGCSSVSDDPTKDWTAEQFYQTAKKYLDSGNYGEAIKNYEQLQSRFPYGRYTEQGHIDIAYAYYKYNDPALALAACDRFLQLYPTHANADYVYYLKGLITFQSELGMLDWMFGGENDMHERNIKNVRESYDSFKELVQRFPNSRYADDARARMSYLFEVQARYQISVARYYYQQGAYVAAVNRAKYTLENYPRTPATEDALGIQAMSYKKMGIAKLYEDTVRILSRNFPQSRYLEEIKTLDKG